MEEGEEKEKKERKKKRREKSLWGRKVSLGLNLPHWLCHRLQLLGAIKAELRVSL
jgi:hypothetical protein